MLGRVVDDPEGVEGSPERIDGLGFLDVETRLTSRKTLSAVSGIEATTGRSISGYEMHMGRTEGRDCEQPWVKLTGRADGAMSRDARVRGCYVHGLFAADEFRGAFLGSLRARDTSGVSYEARVDDALDAWADHLGMHLDVERLLSFSR
jgi:adenosylcobyric acid synthase